ncbi:hypothetical protein H5410_028616 [Solanum commersonii]|uniref:Uncharacterized protein n=1 Tax=Solanum commersonii TaxID=4109 RepID=A0A9J5Z6N0_SOLCO|nr:hypothetical protein H5410_028616 [Solanum commersonii]
MAYPIWRKKQISFNSEEEVIEVVEIGSPLKFDLNNPWKIKKEITPQVLHQENLVISHSETFNYILPYWNLDNAKQLVKGARKGVAMCDVINDTKYNEDAGFIFRKLNNQDDDYSLSVMGLFNIHLLGVGDEIGLYWDPRFQTFMFIILSKVCRKKIFSVNNDLIETGPAQTIHSNNMMHMTKKITSQDITFGELRISSLDMFDYILPYWNLELATSLVNGNATHVALWDATEKKYGRTNRYEDGRFTFRKLSTDDYSLTCMTLINDRGLGVDDQIGLCWNPIISKFIFKLISKVCRKKAFSNTPGVMTQELIETTGPAIIFDLSNIRYLGKFITPQNIAQGTLEISHSETFEYILPYWKLDKAKSLVNGNVEHVVLFDVTEEKYCRTIGYEDVGFTFSKLDNLDYSLSCMGLINRRGLGVGDQIWLCWNPIISKFIFKLISKVCRKKTFSNTPGVMTQELIETTGPAIIFYMSSRRYFRKHITPQNIAQGTLCISSFETSEYILPYWKLDKAKSLVNGNVKRVGVWDVTEEKYGRTNRYEDVSFTFRKLDSLDYSLSCIALINDQGLGVDDVIGLCWNAIISKFEFKLISRAVLID